MSQIIQLGVIKNTCIRTIDHKCWEKNISWITGWKNQQRDTVDKRQWDSADQTCCICKSEILSIYQAWSESQRAQRLSVLQMQKLREKNKKTPSKNVKRKKTALSITKAFELSNKHTRLVLFCVCIWVLSIGTDYRVCIIAGLWDDLAPELGTD